MDQRFYQSSQFAQKASVSVRTLRYYDKVGLLSPSQYTQTGYRLYTNEDLLTLQNILALKFLGFSLEEIRLLLKTGPKRLEELLAQQKAMMEEKRTQLDSIIQALEETERLLQTHQCNWESIVRVIQVIQMGQQNDHWSAKYLTPEQLKTMEELHTKATTEETRQKFAAYHPNEWTEEDQKRVDEQYRFVKQELGRLVAQGADPASTEAQNVARIKQELGFGFSHGDPDIEASVGKWWEEFNVLPEEQKPFDMSVYLYTSDEQDFLEKALAIYQEQKEALLTIKHVFVGIAVAGYDSALAWYKRFFGRPPDVIVSENESMWQVADAGWIYVVGDTTRAGSALITLLVDDLEHQVAELGERGLETSAIETVPGLYRKAVITDPEGNMISLGEDLSTEP